MAKFHEYESAGGQEFELDTFQQEAVDAIDAGRSVLVAAPTGAGKTVVAVFERVIYTAPIKALSNQKFRDFRSRFGDQVGIMTGDVTLNGQAPALIMTTEIFRNALFTDTGRFDDSRTLIFDEVHYINDLERGTVWEESIIFAPEGMQFVCLSATMPNVQELADWISEVRGTDVHVVREAHRPVPLRYHIACGGRLVSLNKLDGAMHGRSQKGKGKVKGKGKDKGRDRQTREARTRRSDLATANLIKVLDDDDRLPCIFFCFSRAACEAKAWASVETDLLGDDERRRIAALYDDLCERYGITHTRMASKFRRLVSHGIAYHHAGMLPTIKEVVERLFSSGGIKLLFTTETFAVGVNMPARTVAFDSLRKFDGVSFGYMQSREYHQMAGRAGRRGMDSVGYVYASVDPDEDDARGVRRVLTGQVERIESRFELAYATILSLYSRMGEAVYEACANSFATFQRRHHHRPRVSPEHEKKLAKKKLAVLHTLGYIEGSELTRRGCIASLINGYELQITEMYAAGVFDGLDADELNVLMVAIVYEARRRSRPMRLPKKQMKRIADPARRCLRRVRSAEKLHRVEDPTKRAEFGLSRAVYHWSRGCEFDELEKLCDAGPGDMIRNLRLAIQLMRQTIKATAGDERLAGKLREAISRLNRDEVDAERQLRVE